MTLRTPEGLVRNTWRYIFVSFKPQEWFTGQLLRQSNNSPSTHGAVSRFWSLENTRFIFYYVCGRESECWKLATGRNSVMLMYTLAGFKINTPSPVCPQVPGFTCLDFFVPCIPLSWKHNFVLEEKDECGPSVINWVPLILLTNRGKHAPSIN